MDDVHFNSYLKYWLYFIKMDEFAKGSQGVVYRNGSYVAKKFSLLTRLEIDRILPWILEFRDLDIPCFYFPKAGIYLKDKLKGCITEYAEGETLKEATLYDEKIETLLRAIEELEEAVRIATKEKIFIWDVHEGNVLFDEDHFNIIDTLSYQRRRDLDESDLLKKNNFEVFRSVIPFLVPHSISFYTRNTRKPYESPLESVKKYVEFLERTLKTSIDTFQEAESVVLEKRISLSRSEFEEK